MSSMNAGFNKQLITPPDGTRMMGWDARDNEHGCEGIHDDLFVRALWIEEGKEKLLMLSFDLCFLSRDLVDRIKGAIGRKIDLLPRQIFINTSHTHNGPATALFASSAFVVPDRLYLDFLERVTISAALKAMASACFVTLSTGSVRCPIAISRRNIDSQGIAQFEANPNGLVYDEVPVCLFNDGNNIPVCLLFSASCHPTTVYGFQISADYPGAAMQKLDTYFGKECSMFLQGMGGDTKIKSFSKENDFGRTWEDVDAAGDIIADNVKELLAGGLKSIKPALYLEEIEMDWQMQPIPDKEKFKEIGDKNTYGTLNRMWAEGLLLRLSRGEKLPVSIQIGIHMVQIGEGVRLIGLEGEAVAGLAYHIRDFFGNGITFPLGYTDGCQLYLPTSKMIDEGGYEVESYLEYGFPAPLAKGMEEIIKKSMRNFSNYCEVN